MTDQTTVVPGAETPAALSNDKRLKDLFNQVNKLGEEASLGKDSLPKLAHAVVKAAADGIIDLETKDAKGNDAASQIYAKYQAGESKKALHEHSAGGTKANVSKLRQLIAVGSLVTIDAVELMHDAFQARENMLREDGVKVKSSYPFYIDVAREQLKEPKSRLTMEKLQEIVQKDAPAPKELEKVLKGLMKTLESLTTDGYGPDKLKDQDENTIGAFELIRDRLDKIATDRKRAELMKNAAALGYKLA